MDSRAVVFDLIARERRRQNELHGNKPLTPLTWLRILVEEVGEVAEELDDETGSAERLQKELVEVAASAVWWLEHLVALDELDHLLDHGIAEPER